MPVAFEIRLLTRAFATLDARVFGWLRRCPGREAGASRDSHISGAACRVGADVGAHGRVVSTLESGETQQAREAQEPP